MSISVQEAMSIGGLQKATIIAGFNGAHNLIEHVSVIEVPKSYEWFRGNELFLSALFNMGNDINEQLSLLEHMKHKNASALAICYPGMYYERLSPVVLRRAEELAIPIIEVPQEVAYIDIISPVIEVIQQKRDKELRQALFIQNQLHEWLSMQLDLSQIVCNLAGILEEELIITDEHLEVIACNFHVESVNSEADINAIIQHNASKFIGNGHSSSCKFPTALGTFHARPIRTGRQIHGYFMVIGKNENSTLESLIYDYVSTSLALHFSHKAIIEETNRYHQKTLIDEWLTGSEMSMEEFTDKAARHGWDVRGVTGIAVIQTDEQHSSLEQLHSFINYFLQKEKNLSVPLLYGKNILLLLQPHPKKNEFESYYNSLFQNLRTFLKTKKYGQISIVFHRESNHLVAEGGKLYKEVTEILSSKKHLTSLPDIVFAPMLPILSYLNANYYHPMSENICRLLDPLEQYDQQYQTDLTQTLEHLLFASNLHQLPNQMNIHRNTLNYRRQRIKEILTVNPFENPYRIQYELAILLRKMQ
jgi:purine catabolism regulator